jgi:NAD(P)H-dependent flavin oxidoreductase YrpB (nitropropane dioxygenase family)
MNNIFGTKYPIICAAMNTVSDINLAIASARSGILPSLIFNNYKSFVQIHEDLSKFKSEIGNCNLLFSYLKNDLNANAITFFKLLHEFKVPYIECSEKLINNPMALKILQEYEIKLIVKDNNYPYFTDFCAESLYAVNIKRDNGAGLSLSDQTFSSFSEAIADCQIKYPHLKIIVSGGISSSLDIKELLAAGADAVAIGTMFAFSEECRISKITKERIVNGNYQLTNNIKGRPQNAIIFELDNEVDDRNNTNSLIKGVEGRGGHLFVGQGIHKITSIRTVNDIVTDLVECL